MIPFLAALAAASIAAVLYALGRAALATLIEAGRAGEKAERAQADARTIRRQGEIMAQSRSVDDVAKRMSQRLDF